MLSQEAKKLIKSLMTADKTTAIRLIAKLTVNQLRDNFQEAIFDLEEIKLLIIKNHYVLLLKKILKILEKRHLIDLTHRFKKVFSTNYKL